MVGAGFGGLQCARRLAGEPVEVTVLDRHNYHLFTPLLYQVASSLLNPSDIAIPVRAILRGGRNLRFRLAEVTQVDLEARRIETAAGASIGYDWLVLAAGSRTNFFGLGEVARNAIGLKDLPDAMTLRNHVLGCFEAALLERDPDRQRAWLTFIVVGGGPTGVEFAGALSELFRLVLSRDFPDLDVRRARVVLLEALDRLLPAFPPELGGYAERELVRRGIEVRPRTRVTGFDGEVVELAPGKPIAARTLVWCAGVRPEALALPGLPQGAQGRIAVDAELRIEGCDREFAIGDLAAARDGGALMPMMAPPAMQAGRHAAENILRAARGEPLRPFAFRDKGVMATIGRSAGVAAIGRLRLKGFVGWVAWLVVHLYYLIGFRNRLAVLWGWAWDYFRYDRPIRLIARARRDTTLPDEP
ncbi:MAG: NAD(P)/FAD-dependent oxidoreductase [Gemmatimonadota bacterium]